MKDAIAGASRARLALAAGAALLVVAAVVLVLVLAFRDDGDAAAELERSLRRPIAAADVRLDAELRVDGSPRFPAPVVLRLSGPYRTGGSRTIPGFDWSVLLTGAGRAFAARLVSTGDNAFVVFQDIAYELGAAEVAEVNQRVAAGGGAPQPTTPEGLGADPGRWLVGVEELGEQEVAGVEATHYSAGVDPVRLLDDLTLAAQRAAPQVGRAPPPSLTDAQRADVRRAVPDARLDAYVGPDGRVRRLALDAAFAVPPENRARAGGATGGRLALTLALNRLDEPVRITPPPDPRPIDDLRRQIGPLVPDAPLPR